MEVKAMFLLNFPVITAERNFLKAKHYTSKKHDWVWVEFRNKNENGSTPLPETDITLV